MSSSIRARISGPTLAACTLAAMATGFSAPSQAVWPLGLGGNGEDAVVVAKTASNGDTYVAGHFSGSIQVGDVEITSRGLQDVFVARINAAGQVLWARGAGGARTDTVSDLILDDANNAYIVGSFFGEAKFGGSGLESPWVTLSQPDQDGYVAKLDLSGSWQWAERMGGERNDQANGVALLRGTGVPPDQIPDSLVVVGRYECDATFGNDNDLNEGQGNCLPGNSDLFVARLESGIPNWIWVEDRGIESSTADAADHIVIDNDGAVYVIGRQATADSGVLIEEDFNEQADLSGWSVSDGALASVVADPGGAISGVDRPLLGLRGNNSWVASPVFDASNVSRMRVSVDVWRGRSHPQGFAYSEYPDQPEERLWVFYNGPPGSGLWYRLEGFDGGGPQGQLFSRQDDGSYVITSSLALHSQFRIGFLYFGGSGAVNAANNEYFDWWHAANLTVEAVADAQPFILPISNARTDQPSLGTATTLPEDVSVADIALDAASQRLYVHGSRDGTTSFGSCGSLSGAGAFIASYDLASPLIGCADLAGATGGSSSSGGAVTLDDFGNVYVTGAFSGSVQFNADPGGTLVSTTANDDIYIASLTPDLNWRWVTGGSQSDESGLPAPAGGGGADSGLALATDGVNTLYLGGRFEAVAKFGNNDTLAAIDAGDGFLVNLGVDGRFFEEESWTVGVPLVPPDNATLDDVTFQPDFLVGGEPFDALGAQVFAWVKVGSSDAQLIPLQPFDGIQVNWRTGDTLQDPARAPSFGSIAWPTQACSDTQSIDCYQLHVVGAPVEAEPAAGNFKVLRLINPQTGASNASYTGGRFTAERSGTSVLVYINGPTLDPTQYPTAVEVVRSVPYDATPLFADNVYAEIGSKITDSYHEEPGRTGWVINELAYYDGVGANAAYNRGARTGAIIPVNRYQDSRGQEQGRELAVAWYHEKSKGVYWPEKAVRYAPDWPFDPERIIVASQQGAEGLGQQPLDPLEFPSAEIYVQNEFTLPGYNPNDEHALLVPSQTGTGFEAVFALRSDYGDALTGDQSAASDPYVLVRYFDPVALERRFRVFRVEATGAGFDSFRFSGTAGTTVSPPYPVRLLPGCGETFVVGQAVDQQPPPPFFQDYKEQLWAKSAGSGEVQYYYPAQPGFFVDLDNNDINDVEPGTCVPWLARLPLDEGGSSSPLEPIKVAYDIAWPDESPLLTIGETLLSPKRGLPDIINQAAIEVVYDQFQEEQVNALPSDTLAQLIDPLNPRWVHLPQIPEKVSSQFQTNGTVAILGSSDGVIKLPVSVRDRLFYDPINRRLNLIGLFDESGAGEPFLLLNVLSKRDRVVLKRLDGGNGSEVQGDPGPCTSSAAADECSWDQAIEALYRQSRNPQGITKICEDPEIDPETRVPFCNQTPRPVSADDVLVGYQDANDDGILEPFQAVGVAAALSAGLSQDEGYLTVAFNNDPSLNPLPVSLEIIQVGCLRSEQLPGPRPYQGQINVLSPENIFDEQLVLRHSGDFGGNPDAVRFEWFFKPDQDGTPPPPPNPDAGQLNGWIQFPTGDSQGAVEISIEGANIQTLSDNWYLARYSGLPACDNATEFGLWAGQPGSTPIDIRAQLAEGWVKRVLDRLNPFEARVQDFAQAATNTYVSMMVQLGERYSGPIALNNDPDNLNSIGLIEAYTTVMRRALQLSVDSTPPVDYGPANAAILLVASRLVEFYTLLGNEAYADAQDPTIGITTDEGDFSLAPSIFNFQNQLSSLLEEELVLLRGRDDAFGPVAAPPVYNRLFWNFTTGDGEVAYALSYNISDQNSDGVIDEFDARILYPQGHGDAWGHYLTGLKIYYELLRHPFYSWNPQSEAVLVAGVPITVDFLDERQFAQTAAAKARTGAEIVDLTYRSRYVEDPNGQYQGYEDSDGQRAWGLSEWGRRAGMGAYFDWVTVNAILPDEDPDPNAYGIQRIDRTTVSEIDEIASHYEGIQGQVDKADSGLNPLGLAKNVVSFDIDPSFVEVSSGVQGETHFEQIYGRAVKSLENAVKVWDFANQLNNQLRRTQNSADDLFLDSRAQETDFSNQLIEIFGYPYADDIGPTGVYPAGYNGPDLYHYMIIDVPALAGTDFDFDRPLEAEGDDLAIQRITTFEGNFKPMANGVNFFDVDSASASEVRVSTSGTPCLDDPIAEGCALGEANATDTLVVPYTRIESPDYGTWTTKPANWTGERRAPGQLQQILQQALSARIALKQALVDYERLRQEIVAQGDTLIATFGTAQDNINVAIGQRNELRNLTIATEVMKNSAIVARRAGALLAQAFDAGSDCVPRSTIVGLAGGGDLLSAVRCGIKIGGGATKFALDTVADGLDIASNATDAAKEDVSELSGIESQINDANLELYNVKGELDKLIREEPILRAEIYARAEAIKEHVANYQATLAQGLRTLERMVVTRKTMAAEVQEYRYRDLAFRIFRNDALQKYRAAFDQAARYVFLAAAAYDYETNLLRGDSQAGEQFLTSIVRERNLGQVLDGEPVAGSPGLANTMAQMRLNFDVLRSQMGFNNPEFETNRFSLRRELFRIPDGDEGDADWRAVLEQARVPDLWRVPEFRRYARPFAPESAGPQPGLVIEFSSNVTFGLNYFGWALGPNDSSYDSSKFSTRVRKVGTWFSNYNALPLADDPRVYLIPVGADVLRSPSANDFSTREWQIVDQAVPIPFPIGTSELQAFDWNPLVDALSGAATETRRYGAYRAFHLSDFDDNEVAGATRLIGRSVWNRRWMLIIPGGTFLNDPLEGIDTFIDGKRLPDGSGQRDGQGVDDILILFSTYAYTGS